MQVLQWSSGSRRENNLVLFFFTRIIKLINVMFLLSYCLYPGLTLSEQDGLFWKVVGGKAQQEIERQMSIIFILFLSNNNVFFCFLFANLSR